MKTTSHFEIHPVMSDLDNKFPTYVSIILNDAFDVKKLKQHGYNSMFDFFFGGKDGWVLYTKEQSFDWRGANTTIQSK